MENHISGTSLWPKNEQQQPEPHQPDRGIKAYMHRRVAVHEMGHAYCAHIFGVPLDYVTIIPKDDMLGNVQLANRANAFDPGHLTPVEVDDWVRKHCVIGFAGNAGTLKLTGESDWEGAREDTQVIDSIIKIVAVSDADRKDRKETYWQEAKVVVNRDWKLICSLAETLMLVKKMTGKQLGREIEKARRGEAE